MPSVRPSSQPEQHAPEWLAGAPGTQILADVQRMALPELARVFGQYALYLRPSAVLSPDLPGNLLTTVLSLHRQGKTLAGQLRCLELELPVCSGSLSLIYALFMLETSADPSALMDELARTLKPEGVALVISVNPWSPTRLRWRPLLLRNVSESIVESLALHAGLEVVRRQYLGPLWPKANASMSERGGNRWFDAFRAASLVVLRRREAGLTPLRKATPAVSLRPGMSAG